MFEQYNFENNVRDNCSLKAVMLMFLPLSFFHSSFRSEKKLIIITLYLKD